MKHSNLRPKPPHCQGQSLQEYAMLFGLVVIVAVAAVSTLGNQSSALIDNSRQTLVGSKSPFSKNAGLLQSAPLAIPGVTTATVTLADGSKITLTDYPTDLAQSVETVGVDGTSKLLAATLKSLAKQLRDSGKISDIEFDQLASLSNKGYQLAEIEGMIEDAARGAKDRNTFIQSSFGVGDTHYGSLAELARSIGWQGADDQSDSLIDFLDSRSLYKKGGMLMPGEFLYSFYDSFRAVDEGGKITDPVVSALVLKLTEQIASLSDSLETVTTDIVSLPEEGEINALLKSKLTSRLGTYKAGGICALGGGAESGVQCSDQASG